jgi:biopolymer transport protein ExbD
MKIRSPIARKRTRLEIIPLIDIMFFLLASFMMVSLQMQKVRTLKASLPTATQITSAKKPDMIKLKVDAYGQVSVDNKSLSFPELDGCWPSGCAPTPTSRFISAAAGTRPTARWFMCLDFVKRAGVQRVAFAVKADPTPSASKP